MREISISHNAIDINVLRITPNECLDILVVTSQCGLIREHSVSGNRFIMTGNISGQEMGSKMLTEQDVICIAKPQSSSSSGMFDMINR